jgi:hypothetical protein
MLEVFGFTIISWALLNSVCALIGVKILNHTGRAGTGAFLGALLGPAGLFVVVLICQWEEAKNS